MYICIHVNSIFLLAPRKVDHMNLCIQNTPMSAKERDYDNTVVTLRLTSAEAVRFWSIMDAAKARNPYVGKSDVYRELLGLAPAQALTSKEIDFFRTGTKNNSNGIPVAPTSNSGRIPLMNAQTRREDVPKKKFKRKA